VAPIHHILDDDIRDFAFGFEQNENYHPKARQPV